MKRKRRRTCLDVFLLRLVGHEAIEEGELVEKVHGVGRNPLFLKALDCGFN